MTRKTYVKWLMSCGFPRNEAEVMAITTREKGISYLDDMQSLQRGVSEILRGIERFTPVQLQEFLDDEWYRDDEEEI